MENTDTEVLNSRKKNGSNIITSTKKNSFLSLLLESLGDPIIRILLIALAIKTIFLFILKLYFIKRQFLHIFF